MSMDPAALSPEKRALLAALLKKQGVAAPAPAGIPRLAAGASAPLSSAQERLWFLEQMEPGSTAYNLPVAVRLRGAVDAAALSRALREIVDRHQVLRSVFRAGAEGPEQVVLPLADPVLSVEDFGGAGEDAVRARTQAEFDRAFDLENGPLYRFALLRVAADEHVLLATFHHAVADGWSLGVLHRELSALYGAFARGEASPLAPLPVQYADFAAWQRAELSGEALETKLAYWRGALAGAPAVLELPTDRPRGATPPRRALRARAVLPRALWTGVETLAREAGASPFMVLLAAFGALLARHAGQDDVVIGSPVAGRPRGETEGMIGLFVNSVALRADLAGDPSFRALVQRVRETALGAFAHQDVPLELLVKELAPDRAMNRAPLFQVMFALQNADEGAPRLDGIEAEVLTSDEGHAKFDLLLALRERPDGIHATLEYASELWDASSAERMIAQLHTLLRAALATPDAPVSRLPLADAAERAMLASWSGGETPFPRATVDALFAERAAAAPHAVALAWDGGRMTYAELDARASRLARHLRGLGVAAGTRVGICLERGPELVVATLAVLKAGGAYVPLDPAYPADRLAFMLEDTAVRVLVTETGLVGRLPAHSARVVSVDGDASAIAAESGDFPDAATGPESVSYVMYTSGSTGRPKGIEIPHRAVVRLVRDTDYLSIDPSDVFLQLAPASFDAATLEIWGPLLNGARLAIHPPVQPSVESIAEAVEAHGVSILWLTAGLFHLVVDERIDALRPVRQLLAGGDVLSVPHVRRVLAELPGTTLINGYGPTENTTFTCCHRVVRLAEDATSVPIGRPIANTRVHVLDAALQPVPVGVPGELYTGGAGLALGYLNRPELTAEKFVADPFVGGERLYRTGDRVRWVEVRECESAKVRKGNGDADPLHDDASALALSHSRTFALEFLGRVDTQVKIRGFRIEPGEVENAVAACPGVREAVVVVRDDAPGGRGLVAYVVGDADAVRAHLKARLPEYMLPAAVVAIDALPLTPNGKVDRRALPAPDALAAVEAGYVAPRTPTEEVLAGAWAAVLGVERVGAHDDFFALGGHSLLAARAVSRIRQAFGVELPLRTLFEAPTVAQLAASVDALRGAPAAPAQPIVPIADDLPLPLSFAQERLWILDQMEPGSTAYNVAVVWRLRGVLDVAALERAFTSLVTRHAALRTVFRAEAESAAQVIHPAAPVTLSVENVSAEQADAAARDEADRPFDLAAGPLMRVRLLRVADDEHRLLLTLHHAVTDAWSLGIMHRELSAAYAAAVAGDEVDTDAPALRYADFAAWQRAWLTGDVLARQVAYWRAELDGAPALLELPADRPRPAARSGRGARVSTVLDAELLRGLNALGRREGATLYMTLLAAFSVLMARLSGQDDVVVGSPIAGRTRVETEGLVGFFINSLALRTRLEDDPTFAEALARVRRATLDAYAHQDVPFEKLVEELQPERALDRSPVFQVMFALQNAEIGSLRMPGIDAERISGQVSASKLDLSVHAVEAEDGLRLHAFYATDLFDEATVARMLGHFGHILRAVVTDAAQRVHRLPLLGDAERAQVLQTWNATARPTVGAATLHAMIEAQAARTPDAVAVVSGDTQLSYSELDARANRVARRLRAIGVDAESRVAICLERSADTLVAILSVLKAGGAYVPVDPNDPAERVAWLLEDSAAAVVITAADVELPAHGAPTLRIDEIASTESSAPIASAAGPESAAYVIYTSGSTGRPKGVVIEHRNITGYVHGILAHLAETPCRTFATVSTFSADLGNTVVFPALCTGGALHVVATETATDAAAFGAYVREHGIDCLKIVPSHLQALMGGADPAAALPNRLLILGGEASRTEWVEQIRAMAPALRVINHYGPTETTVGVLTLPVDREILTQTLPLGRPLPNVRIYVLDTAMQPRPVGVPGELYIGGAQVARGYLNRPDLTADRFVANPFVPGDRLYRTGDRARWLADGTIEFLGRMDDQVKIRGFRIEPGEVAAALGAHPSVRDAAVIVREDGGERRLVAYVVGDAPAAELRAYLGARLPEAMVPSAFVAMDALPITRNGKLDRRALPAPELSVDTDGYVAPRTPTEEVVAEIWAELLGVERVGAEDGFFALGGHSLLGIRMVSRVRAALGAEVPLKAVFESATLTAFAARVDAARGAASDAPPMARADRSAPLPLSFAQQRLWFLQQLDPASNSYNMPYTLRLRGDLDTAALERAIGFIVARHEALRTRFELVGDEPVQVIDPAVPFQLSVEAVDSADAARARAEAEAAVPFDLERGPLFRASLLRVSADDHLLVIVAHHAVSDGWSLDILFRELAQASEAYAAGREPALPPLPLQYADFAAWQRAWLDGGETERQLRYWRGALAGAPAVLELPTDRPRPAQPGNTAARHAFVLPAETAAAVRALARSEGATPFMVLLAAFQLLLARYSGADDVVVGAPVAGRTRAETEGVVGFFINTLPLRARLDGAPDFRALLEQVRAATLEAHAHQDVPLERIVEAVGAPREGGRPPLFQTLFVMQGEPRDVRMGGVRADAAAVGGGDAKFELSLGVQPRDGALHCSLEYAPELWDAETARRMGGHFVFILSAALAEPGRAVGDLPMLLDDERRALAAWNATDRPYPPVLVHEAIARQAARTPDAVALTFEGTRLTYAELDARANQLANRLRRMGVGMETRVGLLMDRGLEMVVAILGTLKAGGAYVPMDPSYPADRLAYMAEDSRVAVLLTQDHLADLADAHTGPVLRLDGEWASIAEESAEAARVELPAHALAYVIYTSGSTGRPKGAMNEHRGIANRVVWMQDEYGLTAADVVLQKTPFSFDVSVWEFLWPLMTGARMVVARPDGHRDPAYLAELIQAEGVTTLHFVPSMLQAFLDGAPAERCTSVRRVMASGEALPAELADRFFARMPAGAQLHNLYGPTEAAVDVTYWPCAAGDPRGVPIGRPVANTRIHVLDPRGAATPPGVAGELHIGGVQVGRGYLGRPALTAEKFIPDPFSAEPAARMYRTGDLARWGRDGAVDYLGRIDFQVKVRGFRIELGEIEAVLRAHPGVRDAAVLARPDASGDLRLVGYVAAPADVVAVADLQAHAAARLPAFMVPSAVVVMDAFPVTPNGKLDRKALPEPEAAAGAADAVAPRTPAEELLAGIWAQVLGRDAVGVHDDFFALGGHSLLATRVAARVRQAFGVELPLRAMFEASTVAGLAERIAGLAAGAHDAPPPLVAVARDGGAPASFAQQRLWFLDRLDPQNAAYALPAALRLRGTLDVPALEHALSEVVARHEALRTVFREERGEPVQVILPPTAVSLDVEAITDDDALRTRLAEERGRPFDLAHGPVFRPSLFRVDDEHHVLLLNLHHVAGDGWSLGVLFRELGALYKAYKTGQEPALAPLPVQYADYAAWQRAWLAGPLLDAQLGWWTERLRGAPALLEVPTDRPRTAGRPGVAAREPFALPADLVDELKALARREGATLYMVLLAAWSVLLSRWSGQDDVVVGSPIAGRTRAETEGLIGFFVNTLALRTDLSGDPDFRTVLARVRQAALGAYAHQELPFERLVEALGVERSLAHAPLFQAVLSLQNADDGEIRIPGLDASAVAVGGARTKVDLVLGLGERAGALDGALEYAADLWDAATVRRMLAHFRGVLHAVAADASVPVSAVELMDGEERRTTLVDWNRTESPYPRESSVHALIRAHALASPDAVAVAWDGGTLTYAELESRANRLARHLRGRGVRLGTRVAVCAERSPELIVALVAVLKAGGAFVPLDPAYPAERLALMLGDAGVPVLVAHEALAATLPAGGIDVVRLDADADRIAAESDAPVDAGAGPDDVAYVMFTSGSTGRPKGVEVPHRGIVRLSVDPGYYDIRPDDVILQMATVSFDGSTLEIWGALLNGARLALFPDRVPSLEALAAAIDRHGVTYLLLTAGLFTVAVDGALDALGRLRLLMSAGDVLSPAHARRVLERLPQVRLVNGYGPTENSVATCWHVLGPDDAGRASIPIGRPVRRSTVYVLDRAGRPCPVGVPGELCTGGDGVARGYVGRPAATAERFVPDPFGGDAGARMYRTGDRARWLPDGTLEFLGRVDQQVKIRGFRIEPGEVEQAAGAIPGVAGAAVAVRADGGERRLVAYVVPAEGVELTPAGVRAALRDTLPEHLLPAAVVVLDALPLNPVGKVDRAALPAPDWGAGAADAFVAPRTDDEVRLAGIWADLLRVPRVGLHDDFFLLGGHSLLATQLVSHINEAFGVSLPLRAVFETPTVAGLLPAILTAAPAVAEEPAGRDAAAQLLDRIDDLSEDEMDALLASLAADQDLV
jgi:amino acid adenylation domain-containing protein